MYARESLINSKQIYAAMNNFCQRCQKAMPEIFAKFIRGYICCAIISAASDLRLAKCQLRRASGDNVVCA